MTKGWKAISITEDVDRSIREFQILAISKTGKVHTLSSALRLALEMATKELNNE